MPPERGARGRRVHVDCRGGARDRHVLGEVLREPCRQGGGQGPRAPLDRRVDGDVAILQTGKAKKLIAEINMGSSVYCTPVAANGSLLIANRNQLFSIAEGAGEKKTE